MSKDIWYDFLINYANAIKAIYITSFLQQTHLRFCIFSFKIHHLSTYFKILISAFKCSGCIEQISFVTNRNQSLTEFWYASKSKNWTSNCTAHFNGMDCNELGTG